MFRRSSRHFSGLYTGDRQQQSHSETATLLFQRPTGVPSTQKRNSMTEITQVSSQPSPLKTEFSLPIAISTRKKYQLPRGFSLSFRANNNNSNSSSNNANSNSNRNDFGNHRRKSKKQLSPAKFLASPMKSPSTSSTSNYPIEDGYYEASLSTKRAIFRQLRSQTATIENPTDAQFAQRVHYNGLIVMDPIPLLTPPHAPSEQLATEERRRMYHNSVNDVSLLLFNEYVKKSSQIKDTLVRSLERQIVQEEKAKNPISSTMVKASIFTKNLKRKLVRNIKQQKQNSNNSSALSESQQHEQRNITTSQSSSHNTNPNADLYDPLPARTKLHDAMPVRSLPKTHSGSKISSTLTKTNNCDTNNNSSNSNSRKQLESLRSTLSNRTIQKSDSIQSTDQLLAPAAVPPATADGQQGSSNAIIDKLTPLLQFRDPQTPSNSTTQPQRRVYSAKDPGMSSKHKIYGPYNPDIIQAPASSNIGSSQSQKEQQQEQLDQSMSYQIPSMQMTYSSNLSSPTSAFLESTQQQAQHQQISGFYPIQQRVFSANSGLKRSTIENIYSTRINLQSQQQQQLHRNKNMSINNSHDSLLRSTQNSLHTASLQQFLRGMSDTQSSGGFSARL